MAHMQVSKVLLDMGCYEISLGDTIGTVVDRAVANIRSEILKSKITLYVNIFAVTFPE